MKTSSAQPSGTEIQTMFDRLAPRYDRFNKLVSLGMDRLWREEVLKNVRDGERVLDLGCGTGDLAIGAAQKMKSGEVVGLDFSASMLEIARNRAWKRLGAGVKVSFVRGAAEELPLEGSRFDLVVSGFVLRNIYERIGRVMRGVHQTLIPGGRIAFVDFTEPPTGARKALWKTYMNTVGAAIGWSVFGKQYPSFYLTDSAKRFLKPEEFCSLLRDAGFSNIRLKRFMMGIIVLYEADKA